MTTARREQLEMAGYDWGRQNSATCYRHKDWSDEEAGAFRKGYDEGKAMYRKLGHK